MHFLASKPGGKDDDSGGGDVCHLLAALPHLLHPGQFQQGHLQATLHPTGLSGHLLAGHELHHVQPHHLLLSQPEVGVISISRNLYKCRGKS